MSSCSALLKVHRHNFYQLTCFPPSHIQGIPCPAASMAKPRSICLPPSSHSSSMLCPKALHSKPSRCPHTAPCETQHRSSPPHWENAILKGCNISLVWFQGFFDVVHTSRGSVLRVLEHIVQTCCYEVKSGVLEQIQGHVLGSTGPAACASWSQGQCPVSFCYTRLCAYIHFYHRISILILR